MFGKRARASVAVVAAVSLAGCGSAPEVPLEVVETPVTAPGVDLALLRSAIPEIEQATDTTVGLSLFDGTSNPSLGSITSMPAWSTIKIPISFAALAHCDYDEDYLNDLITSAIEVSDNEATDELWGCLQTAGGAEELVEEEIGVPVDVAWGCTQWTLPAQARYTWNLSRRDDVEDNVVIGHMRHIDKEQSWGLGGLGIPFKGGWGDVEEDGTYQARQMGFGRIGGVNYGIAIAATSENGSYDDAIKALDAIARVLASF